MKFCCISCLIISVELSVWNKNGFYDCFGSVTHTVFTNTKVLLSKYTSMTIFGIIDVRQWSSHTK